MNDEPYVIERIFNAPVEIVWNAITDKNEMKQWYFDLQQFKLEVGFEFQFYAGDEKKQWLHVCKIIEVLNKKKLSYSWKYDGYPGISYVTFELFPVNEPSGKIAEKTRLKLTHTGLNSFPGDSVPELKRENFAAGWIQIIGTSLHGFLEKINQR